MSVTLNSNQAKRGAANEEKTKRGSMETAKDILEGHRRTGAVNIPMEDALRAVEEIADKAWEAAEEWKDEQLALNLGLCPQPEAIDKSTFMKSLFPDTK